MANPAPVALSRSRASSLSRSSSSHPLHHSHSHSQRPTTPLRRISSSSLRALSLSHSASRRSHGGTTTTAEGATGEAGAGGDAVDHGLNHHQGEEAPLVHLAPILAELADSVSDLTSNLDQLELVHARLDGFNDALAAWLLGLRANGYTVDFVEAPTRLNFELSRQRQQERAIQEEEERVKALLSMQQQHHNVGSSEDDQDDDDGGGGARNRYGGADNTFVSSGGGGADASFVSNQGFNDHHHHAPPPSATRGGRGRGGGSGSAGVRGGRGAGGRGGARGGAMAAAPPAAARKRKEEMATFADPILPLLPIDIREKRRAETEKVLWALRERPNGTTMQDLVASLASGGPSQTVPQVRINECLLALARAKVVVKAVVKGATTYRLDPNKCAV